MIVARVLCEIVQKASRGAHPSTGQAATWLSWRFFGSDSCASDPLAQGFHDQTIKILAIQPYKTISITFSAQSDSPRHALRYARSFCTAASSFSSVLQMTNRTRLRGALLLQQHGGWMDESGLSVAQHAEVCFRAEE